MGPDKRQCRRHHSHDQTGVAGHAETETWRHRQRVVQRRATAHAAVGNLRGHKGKVSTQTEINEMPVNKTNNKIKQRTHFLPRAFGFNVLLF